MGDVWDNNRNDICLYGFGGEANIDRFYDAGEVYEYIMTSCYNATYNQKEKVLTALEDNPYHYITTRMEKKEWKYLEIKVNDPEEERKLKAELVFYGICLSFSFELYRNEQSS